MSETLIERYAADIDGVLSCWDRVILTGTLGGVCYAQGMESWLRGQDVKLFDYPTHMDVLRLQLRANAEQIAVEAGLQIEFIRNTNAFRKEKRIKEILAERGEEPGLVHVFSAMECCTAFRPWHDKSTGRTMLRNTKGKCLHYYFYFIDCEFGLCYLRVPTWAPFRLQFYCNGHSWLAAALARDGIGFTKVENSFPHIDDWQAAQNLADAFPTDRLHRFCDRLAERLCPIATKFGTSYYWSIMQSEYSTDLVFRQREALGPLYEALTRTAVCAVKAPDVAMFLGRKLDKRFDGELGSSFHTRVEGTCIRHHMGPAAVKLYDKFGLVLRIETTCNDVSFFSHYRTVEHRDGTREKKYAPVRKSVYSLGPLRELLWAVNRRYLKFISDLSDPSAGVRRLERLSKIIRVKDRGFRGFNLFHQDDLKLFEILVRGENNIAGISNRLIRQHAPEWSSGRVSRILKRLRLHGLLRRIGHTYRYYLTVFGRHAVLTALKLRELVVIPALANF